MDHNIEDSLNLEGSMDNMDFDNSGVVVSQADITLETSGHEGDMPMEFEEQEMLMDTGTEEIIVTDFMGEQFTLQEYTQDDHTNDSHVTVQFNQMGGITSSSSDTMIDLQLDADSVPHSVRQATTVQPKYISVKAPITTRTIKKAEAAAVPRQVAIAPKPPKLVQAQKATFSSGKQYTIAPKPVALVVNKSLKKVSLPGVQTAAKGTTIVRPQMNKQYVMVPTDGSQKIKLVSARTGATLQCVPSNSDHAQLIPNKTNSTQIAKPVMGKVIMQGQSAQDATNQPAVIRKLLPTSTAATHARYVMQPKTVPIFIGGNKVLLASPTKQGMKLAPKKQQIIAIKSSPQKIMPVTSQATTKKVVITANPNNVILKTTAPPKAPTVSKDGNIVVQGQRTMLHQINVPGKGIQYIRLITNSSEAASKPATTAALPPRPALPALPAHPALSPQPAAASNPAPPHKPGSWGPILPTKSFLLTDNKGNLIQMAGEKVISGQPPPLVITGNIGTSGKVTSKQERKLVRIAPVTSKSGQAVTTAVRSSQSLLAPVAPPEIEEPEELLQEEVEEVPTQEQIDDVLEEQPDDDVLHTLDIKYENIQSPDIEETTQNMEDSNDNSKEDDHPLIVIPSTFRQIQSQYPDSRPKNIIYSDEDSGQLMDDQKSLNDMVDVETEIVPYQSPRTPQALSDSDLVTTELGLRPRKACNCTKSQCLKLYCDCFANGEFCNSCNCTNCHNNLKNEELRQKAIRACLDRNPNAFRPKIGKAKSGGPDIIRRHNKGCNCKRSGCLKNYCECYEAKIACTAMCKCVGCRNVEETLERRRNMQLRDKLADSSFRPASIGQTNKQPCSFMTSEVIEGVCQCLVAAALEGGDAEEADPMRDVIEEFALCLHEIIGAAHKQGHS